MILFTCPELERRRLAALQAEIRGKDGTPISRGRLRYFANQFRHARPCADQDTAWSAFSTVDNELLIFEVEHRTGKGPVISGVRRIGDGRWISRDADITEMAEVMHSGLHHLPEEARIQALMGFERNPAEAIRSLFADAAWARNGWSVHPRLRLKGLYRMDQLVLLTPASSEECKAARIQRPLQGYLAAKPNLPLLRPVIAPA